MMKTETLEINLDDFSKEELIYLIKAAHLKDMTFNQFIVHIIERTINEFKTIERLRTERATAELKE